MAALLHGLGEGNAAIGGLGQISGPQPVRGKLSSVQSCHAGALLDDGVDRLRIEYAAGNVAPAIDGAEHSALIDATGLEPGVARFDRLTGEIDDLILICA